MVAGGGAARRATPVPAPLFRRLLVVLAALAVLASGGAPLLPRSADAVASVAASSVVAPAASRSTMSSPETAGTVRGGTLASVPGPGSPGAALPPGSRPLVAPHLVGRPQSRPPTTDLVGASLGAPGSRAPPVPAGT